MVGTINYNGTYRRSNYRSSKQTVVTMLRRIINWKSAPQYQNTETVKDIFISAMPDIIIKDLTVDVIQSIHSELLSNKKHRVVSLHKINSITQHL